MEQKIPEFIIFRFSKIEYLVRNPEKLTTIYETKYDQNKIGITIWKYEVFSLFILVLSRLYPHFIWIFCEFYLDFISGFYPDSIQILSRLFPDSIWILSGFYPDSIRILFGFHPESRFYPDSIQVLSGYILKNGHGRAIRFWKAFGCNGFKASFIDDE